MHQLVGICIVLLFGTNLTVKGQTPVSFNRDVRPILSKSCFACHGPDEDKREADLRLDDRKSAIELGAIMPGQSSASVLIDRINETDEDLVMPPSHLGHPLSAEQKATLKRWIDQGAKYETHWAFEKPKAAAVPQLANDQLHPIDAFVREKLKSKGLESNPAADRYTLVRRLYLDLIGLPPTVEQADRFVNSTDPNAYKKLVDELLASKHYGERWAQPWLDLARYSDTNGYEKDRERSIWPFRDWVIRAINDDLPYDQFSIHQLAGDMLPNSTTEQTIATGFHRNTMLNEEGGIDPLEYRYLAMVDRVATTGAVWLGLTTGCAQCHTHKYDPISHTEYFQLMALMNNAEEPDFKIPDVDKSARIENAKQKIAALESKLKDQFPTVEGKGPEDQRRKANFDREFGKWIEENRAACSQWQVLIPADMKTNLPRLTIQDDGSIFSTGDTTKRDVFELEFELPKTDQPFTAIRLEAIPDDRLPANGPGRAFYEGRKGDFFVSEVSATLDGQAVEFSSASHDFSKTEAMVVFDGDGSTGWRPGGNKGVWLHLVMNFKQPIDRAGNLKITLLFERHYVASLGRFRISATANPTAAAVNFDTAAQDIIAGSPREQWTTTEIAIVEKAFLLATPLLAEARKNIAKLTARIPRLDETMVFQERPADFVRLTHRHHRGEFLSPREQVGPGLPEVFSNPTPENERPKTRLELAKWLVGDHNPLAARVAVNRDWREFFGAGLMRTNADFGVQSKPPAHPELLDWLAVQFQYELGWSRKKLHRLIVTSETYKQDSSRRFQTPGADPDNEWLSRGPGFRVSGEMVRDIALRATDSLSTKMYGPGVRPPQPASVTALAYGGTKWVPSKGENRFRRSVYTFKKRTANFAAYTVFDAPTGETCTARRNRSNTPLQALTVLNDEMYTELSQKLARKLSSRQDASVETLVNEIFRRFLTRRPNESEMEALSSYFEAQAIRIENEELDAHAIAGKGNADESPTARQAALVMLIRVIMNLDETVTKR